MEFTMTNYLFWLILVCIMITVIFFCFVHILLLLFISILFIKKEPSKENKLEGEDESHSREIFYRSILSSILEGVIVFGKNGDVLMANDSAARILELNYSELRNYSLFSHSLKAIHEDGRFFFPEEIPFRKALETGEPIQAMIMGLKIDNQKIKWVVVSCEVLFQADGKTVSAVVSAFIDISKQKQQEMELKKSNIYLKSLKEEAERASRAKTIFLSRMSHELRTPLNSMLGFAQLLEDEQGALTPKQQEMVRKIKHAGNHLLFLLNEALDLHRIESDQTILNIEPLKVPKMLEEAIKMIEPMAKEKKIMLTYNNKCNNATILVDKIRFNQIMFNLLSNGVKYNNIGGELIIDCEQDYDSIKIYVQDSGIGIAEHELTLIFEPFYRSPQISDNIEGTGIGLPVAKQLIERMGGMVQVESEEGKGSCFTITFPLLDAENNPLET